jgi:hypothetical protein
MMQHNWLLLQSARRHTTLASDGKIFGEVYFPREKKKYSGIEIRLPLGTAAFEFPWQQVVRH